MRYSHSKFRVDIPVTAMRKQIVRAAVRDAENSMTKKRFVATFASLLLCLVLVYSSFFYVPGYIDLHKVIGMSNQDKKLPQKAEEPGTLDRYKNMFKMRRGYLSTGQNLVLKYNLSPDTVISASIGRCKAPPIIEVFYCQKIDDHPVKIRSLQTGTEKFVIQKPGFYYFDEVVTNADGSKTDKPYQITWSRGQSAATRKAPPLDEKRPSLRLRPSPS